ncbi:MAG: response regulator [Anaerolineae bacterium]
MHKSPRRTNSLVEQQFAPGIRLMNRLKLPPKFALISLLFALPLALALTLLILQLNSSIDLAQKEKEGTTYLRALRGVYQEALRAQILDQDFQNGLAPEADVIQQRARIDAYVNILASVEQRSHLGTAADFQTLKTDWEQIKGQPVATSVTTDLNSKLANDARDMIASVGDSSNLNLDPQLDSRNLNDTLLLILPDSQSLLTELLVLDVPSMAQQGSTAGLARTSTLIGQLQSDFDDSQSRMQVAFKNTRATALQPTLQAPLSDTVRTGTDFINSIGRIWNTQGVEMQPGQYRFMGLTAFETNFKLWDTTVNQIESLLDTRIGELNQQKSASLIVTLLMLLGVAYLWVAFYFAVRRTVTNLDAASQRMVNGTMTSELVIENRDELGQIVASFNKIASALIESSAYRQSVVDNAADGILTTDETGKIISFNPAAERIFGYPSREAIGLYIKELVPTAGDTSDKGLFYGLLDSASYLTQHHEVEGCFKNGYLFPLDMAVSKTQVGQRQFYICMMRDISDLKRAEAAIKEYQRQLADIINLLPDATFVIDDQGKVIFWNRAIQELTGVPAAQMLGKGNYEYAIPFYGERSPMLIDLAFKPSDDPAQYREVSRQGEVLITEAYVPSLRGKQAFVVATASALRDAEGRITGAIQIIRDRTERKRMEIALSEAKETAEAATQAKSAFLATMSHEIRTPMNAVIGMTGLLLDTPLTPDQREFAETIRSSGDSLLTIINDILDFSKIEAGRMSLESRPLDLRECVESAAELLAAKAAEKGLDLLYDVDKAVPGAIFGDVTRLRQILVNLIGNSLKFTEKGEVVVSVTLEEKGAALADHNGGHLPASGDLQAPISLHFVVRDTGLGIPPDRVDRLFQSFSQVDASTTRRFGGTGLGLAISKRLAELMGGSMWVESEGVPGKGSAFHFTILGQVAPPPAVHAYLQGVQPHLDGKRVLIVDDNATNRRILILQTQSWGMVARDTGSPEEALKWVRKGDPFDIALLDYQMPDMDGAMLASEIRKLRTAHALPLIMLSSLGRRETDSESNDFAAFLLKPIKASQLYNSMVGIFGAEAEVTQRKGPEKSQFDAQLGQRHPLRLLLAEDNAVNQKLALRLLDRMGYRADIAGNGLEVLESLRRQPYDVVFMDVQMPEMDGLDATRAIWREWPREARPRIIAMTANAMQEDREQCLAAGMDDFVTKPIKVDELIAALMKCQPIGDRTNSSTPT